MLARDLLPSPLIKAHERKAVPLAREESPNGRTARVIGVLVVWYLGNLVLRLGGKRYEDYRRRRTLRTFRELGMVWRHVASTVSMRTPGANADFQKALLDMPSQAAAQPFDEVLPVLREDLPAPLEEIFEAIEDQPFAATTVSQIHRARLRKEGAWVAVKIQHSLAAQVFERDLRLFRRMVRLANWLRFKPGMRWGDLAYELSEMVARELDYSYEASALQTLRHNLRGLPVYVPAAFGEYCGKRVLVMEFIQGALLSDVIQMRGTDPLRAGKWLAENKIDLDKVATSLFTIVYRQIFEDNFFHGDMRTGKIILLRNSNIALIDCIRVGNLDRESLDTQRLFFRDLAHGEYGTAAEIYFLMGFRLPKINLSKIKEQILRTWRPWETVNHVLTLPYGERAFTNMMHEVQWITAQAGFSAQWSLFKLQWALVHLDVALIHLSPSFDYLKALRDYLETSDDRKYMGKLRQMPERLANAFITLQALPKRMEEYTIFQETMMRRQAQVAHGTTTTMDAVLASMLGLLVFALFLLLVVMLPIVVEPLLPAYQAVLGGQLNGLVDHLMMEFPWQTRLIGYGACVMLMVAGQLMKKRARSN